jgi:hypothetical protein
MSGTLWRRSDQWFGTEVEDNYVMVNLESGKYVWLNATADMVWRALETDLDEDALCEILSGEFDVDQDHCRHSLAACLEKMRSLELVAPL